MLFRAVLLLLPLLGNALEIKDWRDVPPDPDVGKNMVEIVQTRGYEIETHQVTTKDGYILTVFRIPNGKSGAKMGTSLRNKSPVLLQHGLLDSSFTWVSNFEDQSLGYILADAGFDVWFGNNRGNRYGRNHTTLNPDDKVSGFWDLTFDEMGSSDMPSMINYITEVTGKSSVGYVGHSEGTIQMFAAGTQAETNTDPDFQRALKSINLFVALAPVAYVSNMKAKLLIWLASTEIPQDLYNRGYTEFLNGEQLSKIAPEICQRAEYGCDLLLMSLCGPSLNVNVSRIQVYVSQTPAGTSTLNMLHWAQGTNEPVFQKYDYGSDENAVKYGQSTPPQYDLSKLSVPTALFYGKHDYLADPTDVQKIIAQAPADKIVFTSYQEHYAHLDYVWAVDANKVIYQDVTRLLKQYASA